MEKRSLFNSLPGMTGLSLMNPWHATRTLLNPEVHEGLYYKPVAETRHQRSVMDELNPFGPKFFKAKLRAMGPMFKRDQDEGETISSFHNQGWGERNINRMMRYWYLLSNP